MTCPRFSRHKVHLAAGRMHLRLRTQLCPDQFNSEECAVPAAKEKTRYAACGADLYTPEAAVDCLPLRQESSRRHSWRSPRCWHFYSPS